MGGQHRRRETREEPARDQKVTRYLGLLSKCHEAVIPKGALVLLKKIMTVIWAELPNIEVLCPNPFT
jgi:hypothetical protein